MRRQIRRINWRGDLVRTGGSIIQLLSFLCSRLLFARDQILSGPPCSFFCLSHSHSLFRSLPPIASIFYFIFFILFPLPFYPSTQSLLLLYTFFLHRLLFYYLNETVATVALKKIATPPPPHDPRTKTTTTTACYYYYFNPDPVKERKEKNRRLGVLLSILSVYYYHYFYYYYSFFLFCWLYSSSTCPG